MAERIVINDVGPRDGLQNQPKILSPAERIDIIRALLASGMDHIEVAAFVSPKAVPAMAGAADVVAGLEGESGEFSVLIPNMKGYELATEAGATAVGMVLYGTDGMANANVRMSKAEAETATEAIIERAKNDGVSVMATISVSFECPFDGPVDPAVIHASAEGRGNEIGPLIQKLGGQGVQAVALCIGATRHFRTLYAAACDPGGAAQGLARAKPPVFGPRRDRMARQAQRWGAHKLQDALKELTTADLTLRSSSMAL